MKKKLTSALLVFCLALSLLTGTVSAAEGYKDSGGSSYPKLSQEEIRQLLSGSPLTMPEKVFDETPSCAPPYSTGKVSAEALQAALNRFNALRRLAGLPGVTLSAGLSAEAQHSAVINAANGTISHYPARPEGMEDAFYQTGCHAASSSNLFAGVTLATAMDGFMDDSDAGNISRLGHRRWQLNPAMGTLGLGYATSNTFYRSYTTEWAFDNSGAGCDYDFISWPASGNFPADVSTMFNADTAWSITLNPSKYSPPMQSEISVTLTRDYDGKSWTFSGTGYTPSGSGDYFGVDLDGYGVSNCIIFRPGGLGGKYRGTYTVTVDGLKMWSGSAGSLSYQVNFFDVTPKTCTVTFDANGGELSSDKVSFTTDLTGKLSEYPTAAREGYVFDGWYTFSGERMDPAASSFSSDTTLYAHWRQADSSGFTDVPSGAYYSDAVKWAVDKGVTNGTAPGKFGPEDSCTRAQTITFIWRAAGSPEPVSTVSPFKDVAPGDYYYKAVLWAVENGITSGVSFDSFGVNSSCDRGMIVTFLWRAAGKPASGVGVSSFTDVTSGDYFYDAVNWAVGRGITNGTAASTFSPRNICDRGQVVAFLYRNAVK